MHYPCHPNSTNWRTRCIWSLSACHPVSRRSVSHAANGRRSPGFAAFHVFRVIFVMTWPVPAVCKMPRNKTGGKPLQSCKMSIYTNTVKVMHLPYWQNQVFNLFCHFYTIIVKPQVYSLLFKSLWICRILQVQLCNQVFAVHNEYLQLFFLFMILLSLGENRYPKKIIQQRHKFCHLCLIFTYVSLWFVNESLHPYPPCKFAPSLKSKNRKKTALLLQTHSTTRNTWDKYICNVMFT